MNRAKHTKKLSADGMSGSGIPAAGRRRERCRGIDTAVAVVKMEA